MGCRLWGLAIVLAALALIGCATTADGVREAPVVYAPIVTRTVHGDTRCSHEARFFVEAAAHAYEKETSGLASIPIVWDFGDASIVRLIDEPMIICSERKDYAPTCGGNVDGDVIRIVPSVCPDLYACALHEIGHYLGLQHVPYGHSVMASNRQVRIFSAADDAELESVGLRRARRRPDVTTVTLTIDPAIPPVEPEYPAWPTP